MIEPIKVYLACPYSAPCLMLRHERFQAANNVAARLMNQGYVVFSPISMSHPIAETCALPKSWEFWARQDLPFLSWADELHVLKLTGWHASTGVSAEIGRARDIGKPIIYIDPVDIA
jgi:nucleoside 2-deoxyribosyltransferase